MSPFLRFLNSTGTTSSGQHGWPFVGASLGWKKPASTFCCVLSTPLGSGVCSEVTKTKFGQRFFEVTAFLLDWVSSRNAVQFDGHGLTKSTTTSASTNLSAFSKVSNGFFLRFLRFGAVEGYGRNASKNSTTESVFTKCPFMSCVTLMRYCGRVMPPRDVSMLLALHAAHGVVWESSGRAITER